MTYESVVTALKVILPSGPLGNFTEKDISLGDYSILSGSHYYLVVIDYDNFERARLDQGGGYLITWHCELMLAVQYQDDVQVHNDLRDLRQEIITVVSNNPGLGIEVYNAEVTSGVAQPSLIELGGNNVAFELLYVDITEQTNYVEVD